MRVSKALKSRPGDQRRALLPLLVQVRFNCAIDLLALFPEEAKAALHRIHEREWRSCCAGAGSLLESLDSGRYVLESGGRHALGVEQPAGGMAEAPDSRGNAHGHL